MDDEHRTDVAVEHQQELVDENHSHAFQSMTLLSLLKTLTKPKTLPHIGLLVTSSIVLFTFFSGSKEYQAMLFISLSLAYVLLGFIFGSKFENLMLPKDADAGIKVLKRIFLPLIPPIVLSIVLFILMVSIFDVENGPGQYLPTFLASLFVVWSILQGKALLHWLRASGHQLPLLPTNRFVLIPMFILIVYVVMFGYDVLILGNTSISWSEYMLMFTLIIITTSLLLYLTRHQKNRSQEQEFQARYTRMLFLSLLFVTWHFFTIQRQLREAGSSALMYFEEIILMIFTVIMSIWALTSRSYKSSLQLVNEENALPVGIAFGFAYAGSIAVLSDLFGDVRNVLIMGHAIVVLTVVLGLGKIIDKIHRSMIQESEVHALVKSLPSPINEIIFQPVEDESTEPHPEFEEIDVAVDGHEDDDVELL